MAILPLQLARVSNYLRSNISLGTIANTQRQLLDVQNQLSTGVRLNAPSDDPGNAQIAIQLQRTLEKRQAYGDNLTAAKSRLNLVDSTLGDVTSILQQVQSLASANVGSDVTAEQRQSAAAVIRSQYAQLVSLSNRQTNGQYLFGGDKGGTQPYVERAGGVSFVGSSTVLQNVVDDDTSVEIGVDGTRVFGGTSSAVLGGDLAPAVTGQTRLADLRGAQGLGVRLGEVLLSDGTQSRVLNLAGADTVQDVLDVINNSGLATASVTGAGISVTSSVTANLSIKEIGGNSTARDLGIFTATSAGVGAPVVGASLSAKVTGLTPLSALAGGAGLVVDGGIRISNGTATYDVSLAGVTTVEGLVNAVNSSGSGALARINAAGNGIDVVNPTQGSALTISELGGTVATQLGVRSLTGSTPLSSLNGGRGVQRTSGADLQITDKTGATYSVDLDGAVTVADVISRINAATGGTVTAALSGGAAGRNGIELTDTTGGSAALSAQSLNFSTAAQDLGLAGTTTGTSLLGTDVNPVRSHGVFDNLLRLAAALETNDQGGITRAAEGLKGDLDRVVRVRGENGAKVQELDARTDSLDDQNLATKSLLSEIKDTDYPSAIARFQLLQTTLQANYSTTSRVANNSLLDFLR